jgi:hypothetical protein
MHAFTRLGSTFNEVTLQHSRRASRCLCLSLLHGHRLLFKVHNRTNLLAGSKGGYYKIDPIDVRATLACILASIRFGRHWIKNALWV